MTDLPPCTVRTSRRARRVSLVVSLAGGLQVVLPRGFDARQVPELLRRKQAWIERAFQRLRSRRPSGAEQPEPPALPEQVTLPAIGVAWQVVYHPGTAGSLTLSEAAPPRGAPSAAGRLALCGATQDVALCRASLKRWLTRRARAELGAWLEQLGREAGLPFQRLSIRNQRTRWGSCSSRGTISLNYKLLFLPRPLVRYVLVHELCHTRQPDHSAAFWALVAQLEPDCRRLRVELRGAWQHIPPWAHG